MREYYNKCEEDHVTSYIVDMLESRCFNATKGTYFGGSTDIIVTHGKYEWIGEAKWFNSNENALEGMRQLATRYSTGGENSSCGGVLLYNKAGQALNKLSDIMKIYGESSEFENLSVSPCQKSKFAFITKHKHQDSGDIYVVRHRIINLKHEPSDKSARNRKVNN